MKMQWVLCGGLFAAAVGFTGCGPPGKVHEEEVEVKEQKALERARQILQTYAKGQQPGSEVTSFPELVEEVKKEDAERGRILEEGLSELQRAKGNTAAKAKELLKKLAPRQGP
jgi:O-phosphoseryl-tRNA(Cys) synthetase